MNHCNARYSGENHCVAFLQECYAINNYTVIEFGKI